MARENFESMSELTQYAENDRVMVQDATDDTVKNMTIKKLIGQTGMIKDVTITSAQLLALNATPVEVIAAPATGEAIIVTSVTAIKPIGTAYAGIAAGEDLVLRYTNGSGAIATGIEATGFLDQTTKQIRHGWAQSAVGTTDPEITPVEAAAIVANLTTGEITTGDTDLTLRIEYRIVDVS